MWFELGVGIDVLCHLMLGTWAALVDCSLSGVVPAVSSDVCVWLYWTVVKFDLYVPCVCSSEEDGSVFI